MVIKLKVKYLRLDKEKRKEVKQKIKEYKGKKKEKKQTLKQEKETRASSIEELEL